MSLKTRNKRIKTVRYRLTAWYLVLFSFISMIVLAVTHYQLKSTLRNRTINELHEDLQELTDYYRTGGIKALKEDFKRESESTGIDSIYLSILSPRGDVIASSDPAHWKDVVLPIERLTDVNHGDIAVFSLTYGEEDEDALGAILKLQDGNKLRIYLSLDEEAESTELFWSVLLVALAGMLITGGVMSWFLAKRAMAGVERITETASSVSHERLGERVDVGNEGKEIADLAIAFNAMLERIDTLVSSLREVTDNLAHDLRTAITRLRGMAETTLTTDANLPEYKELAANVVEEADSLIRLLNTMLEIAETDAGRVRIEMSAIHVQELLTQTADIFRPAAEDAGIQLVCDEIPDDLFLLGDLSRMQRVLANLIDNAIKYTPSGGSITLAATRDRDLAIIRVRDTGAGIQPEDLPRVFERFYRADTSRSLTGSGLGLSLCQTLVHVMEGNITVDSTPGKGTWFTVTLPAIQEPHIP